MSKRTRGVVIAGMLVALFLGGVVSYYASSSPDGLNKVAIDTGLDQGEKSHAAGDSPLAGYALKGVENERLSKGLAGVAGVGVTFLIGGAIALGVRRRGSGPGPDEHHDEAARGRGGSRS